MWCAGDPGGPKDSVRPHSPPFTSEEHGVFKHPISPFIPLMAALTGRTVIRDDRMEAHSTH